MEDLNQKILNEILLLFFTHHLELKMLHFQTKKYAVHKAVDVYLETFLENYDKFMEAAQGAVGRVSNKNVSIDFETLSDNNSTERIDKFIGLLRDVDESLKKYPELVNIKEEIIGEAQKLKYLLTFI